MNAAFKALLFVHVVFGTASVILFWIPVIAKKGSSLHTRTGHWYAKAMYGVGITALCVCLMLMVDPIGFKFPNADFSATETAKIIAREKDIGLFLLAISILTLVGVRHGLQSIQAKGNHAKMRSIDNLAINLILLLTGSWLGFTATGNSPLSVLFYIFAGLCIVISINNLRFCLKQKVTRGEQITAHLSAIIGAGIGAHTAFFLFGISRFLAGVFTGYLALIPWVLPGLVGTIIIVQQAKKYRPKKQS